MPEPDPLKMPETPLLESGLGELFRHEGARVPIQILHRRINDHYSTYASEVVTCRVGSDDGRVLELFCKYGAPEINSCHGHRGGPSLEVRIYQEILGQLPLSGPKFYGARREPTTGEWWLILEYLAGGMKVNKSHFPNAMPDTAEWIGRFHAALGPRVDAGELAWLNEYDRKYYLGWSERTRRFAGDLHRDFPWLMGVCDRFDGLSEVLLSVPKTLIHGEFVMANVMIRDGVIHPIDWESAAIGAGEIDLVMIIDGWDPETVRRCELAYQSARWPDGAPADFSRRLDIARLYVKLRWLGDRPEWTVHDENRILFSELREISERLGLI